MYRWVTTGDRHTPTGRITDADVQILTVVRVNRRTVTVRSDGHGEGRIDPADLEGFWVHD